MRYFEFKDEKSAKFWEIKQEQASLHLRWGKIGTNGQNQTKEFDNDNKAKLAYDKLVKEKTGKGYIEISAQGLSSPNSTGLATTTQSGASNSTSQQSAQSTSNSGSKAATPKKAKANSSDRATTEPSSEAPLTMLNTVSETLDQQSQRAYLEICQQIADELIDTSKVGLTIARIRRLCTITELAAKQTQTMLSNAGLISNWSEQLQTGAKRAATEILQRASTAIQENQTYTAQPELADSELAPWLATGATINLSSLLAPGEVLEQQIYPNRSHPAAIIANDAKRCWVNLRSSLSKNREPDFNASDMQVRDDFVAAWEELKHGALPSNPVSEKILLSLALSSVRWQHDNDGELYIDYLIARYGITAAFSIFLDATCELQAEFNYTSRDKHTVHLTQTITQAWQAHYGKIGSAIFRLRAHLCLASLEQYQACLDLASQRLAHVPVARLVGLAIMFSDSPEFSSTICHIVKNHSKDVPDEFPWLLLNLRDQESIQLVAKTKLDSYYYTIWTDKRAILNLFHLHQEQVWAILAYGISHETCAQGLACIGLPEAVQLLAKQASGSKDALSRFMQCCERWPAATLAALAQILAASSKEQSLLQPSLMKLVRQYPTLAQACTKHLDSAPARVLQTAIARLAAPANLAENAELPEVLRQVPWLGAKKSTATVMNLKPLELAAVELWDESAKQQALELNQWQQNRYANLGKDGDAFADELGLSEFDKLSPERKQFREAIRTNNAEALIASWRSLIELKKKKRYYYYNLNAHAVAHLPAELGIAFWNAIANEASCYGVDYLAARFGIAALPGLILKIQNSPAENFHLALNFGSTELAASAARAYAKSKSLRKQGRNWLLKFPEHAAYGLFASALGKKSEARDCAASALRFLAQQGHTELLDQVAARYQDPAVNLALHAMLNENPLDRFPAKRPALPEFWQALDWHRPQLLNGKALDDQALASLGSMMMFPTNEEIYPGLLQVKAACEAKSLAQFCWDAFSAWLNSGAAGKDNWTLTHLGLFGDDEIARRLTPLIRAWPGESAHARAVTGLDVLAQIGSDTALMLLNGIAQKVKFKGLQDKAREKIVEIAATRGLTQEELEDRLAPDLGLDQQGSLILDFGTRAFKVGFDESLKPYVREWQEGKAGAKLPDLPKPKKTDDEELAKVAVERFKLLKKDARTIASQQVLRLEVAMCQRRRWSTAVFQEFIAQHPLVRHLARRLIWAVYEMPEVIDPDTDETSIAGYGGTMLTCFRVSEDAAYTNANDDDYEIPQGAQYKIGLPHALELPVDIAAEFAQLFADYELLQPFAQLGRDVYQLSQEEKLSDKLTRWNKVAVPTGKVLGLVNIGWRRGPAQDSGCIWTFEKPLGNNQLIELTLDPGIIVGMIDEYPEQSLGELTLGKPGRWGYSQDLLKFAELDDIAASELIRDMERMRT